MPQPVPHEPITAHIPALRRYARALASDPERAEDLLQDSLERAWGRMHLWMPGSDLRAWLFTIMHNVHLNQLRRIHREPSFVAVDELGYDVADTGPATDSAVQARDLGEALALLPDAQREVLLLVAVEALRYDQVAEILGVPTGTVMSRLHRARTRLRQIMDDDDRNGLRRVK